MLRVKLIDKEGMRGMDNKRFLDLAGFFPCWQSSSNWVIYVDIFLYTI